MLSDDSTLLWDNASNRNKDKTYVYKSNKDTLCLIWYKDTIHHPPSPRLLEAVSRTLRTTYIPYILTHSTTMIYFGSPLKAAASDSVPNRLWNPNHCEAGEQLQLDACIPLPLCIGSKPTHRLELANMQGVFQTTNDSEIDALLNDLESGGWLLAQPSGSPKPLLQSSSPSPDVDHSTKPVLQVPEKSRCLAQPVKTVKKTPRAKVSASAAWRKLASPDYHFVDDDRVVHR